MNILLKRFIFLLPLCMLQNVLALQINVFNLANSQNTAYQFNAPRSTVFDLKNKILQDHPEKSFEMINLTFTIGLHAIRSYPDETSLQDLQRMAQEQEGCDSFSAILRWQTPAPKIQ